MPYLRQSTSATVRLGPYLDKNDGVSELTGITPVVEVSKNHGAFAARNSGAAITHDANGWYAVTIDTTDTGTLGPYVLKSDDSALHLPVWREFCVLPGPVYDAIVAGTDLLQVDLVQWLGTAVNSAISGRPDVNAQVVGDKTNYTVASGGLDAAGITAAAQNAIADAILDRNMATGTDSGTNSTVFRTPRQALRLLRNFANIVAGVLTVRREDDTTVDWTAAVTKTAGDPVSSIDPT